jgi:plastocyanin
MMRSMISKKVLAVLASCVLLAFGLAACGGDDSSGSSNAAVTIKDFSFSTKPVKAGESFQVQNKDDTEHTFTSDDGKFDVKVPAGKTVTVDALTAGTYKFHCSIHTTMHGTLDVN